jgi:hypothetical protein
MSYAQNTNQISQVPQNDHTRHSMENNIVHQYNQNVNKGNPVHEPNLSTGVPPASTHMGNRKSENQAYIMVPQHTGLSFPLINGPSVYFLGTVYRGVVLFHADLRL